MFVFPSPPGGSAKKALPSGPTLSAHDKAARLAVLAGGAEALYQRARAALSGGDPQWAAVLADHLLALEPERLDYCLLKADALRAMGSRVFSAASWRGATRKAEEGIASTSGGGADSPLPRP
ncbi:MAG: hypothetical protein J1E80_08345 [Desulfovibrionaceae bacterium]|nr:hypothetical protein [Desulfovibrionaceae bacterium]